MLFPLPSCAFLHSLVIFYKDFVRIARSVFHVKILYMSERLNFRQLLREKDPDAVVYIIGICIFFITGITALIIKGIAVRYNINILTECLFRHLTGLYCPGCGGTRAFIYLIHGNIPESILYHPLVIYAVILTAFFI